MTKKSKFIPLLIIITCTFVISLGSKLNSFARSLPVWDGSMFLYFGRGINHGLVPYRDMFDHKGPILWFIQSIGTLFSNGDKFYGVYFLELLSIFITLFYIYKIFMFLNIDKILAMFVIIFQIPLYTKFISSGNMGGNFGEEYALPFIVISIFIMIKLLLNNVNFFAEKFAFIYLLFVGISFGLVFFIRANMISAWVVFCLAIAVKFIRKSNYKYLFRTYLYLGLGFAIVTIPICIYCLVTNSFRDMLFQTFIVNFCYSKTLFEYKIAASNTFWNIFSLYGYNVIVVVFLIYSLLYNKRNKLFYFTMSAYMFLNWYTIIMAANHSEGFFHYCLTQLIPLCIAMGILINKIFLIFQFNLRKILICCLFLMMVGCFDSIKVYENMKVNLSNQDISIEKAAKFIKANSHTKDKIFTYGLDANIYLLSHRFSHSRFFVLPSLNYEKFPNLRQEFQASFTKNPPKFIVIPDGLNLLENTNPLILGILNEIIKGNYHEVKQIDYIKIFQKN